jgi:hypothetical protein
MLRLPLRQRQIRNIHLMLLRLRQLLALPPLLLPQLQRTIPLLKKLQLRQLLLLRR